MSQVFSDDWARAWGTALSESSEYRAAASTWEGSIAAVATAESGLQLAAAYLDVWHGDCREARAASAGDIESATYLLDATPAAWRDLFEGRLAPVMGLMTGRIRVARGELAKLLPYAGAAKELIRLAGTVPTTYPEGW